VYFLPLPLALGTNQTLPFWVSFWVAAMANRGRPPKPKGERKNVHLRIPVTPEQKARITKAVMLVGGDMATWARPILLQAAESALEASRERSE
jgi:hypothetical protein